MKQQITWKTLTGKDVMVNVLGISQSVIITAFIDGSKIGEGLYRNPKSPSGYAIGKLALNAENLDKINAAIKIVKTAPEYNYMTAREKELEKYEKDYAAIVNTMNI